MNKANLLLAFVFGLFGVLVVFGNNFTGFVATDEVNSTDNITIGEILILDIDEEHVEKTSLAGIINLELDDKIFVDEPLTVKISGKTYSKAISEILKEMNIIYTEQSGYLNASNSSTVKEVVFDNAGERYISVQLPRYGIVNSLEMDLEGIAYDGSYLENVTIDFGDEGNIDWYYFGDFIGYNNKFYSSNDFDGSAEDTAYLVGNDTYYCEMIDIPETKNIEISAEYTKKGVVGDIKAVVLSIPGEDPKYKGYDGGNDICDLPENKGSCEIELDYMIEGKYLFCVFSESAEDDITQLYELPVDSTARTTTSFNCPISEEGFCTENFNDNFIIKVRTARYNKAMHGMADFSESESFYGSAKEGLKFYIGSEGYSGICASDICIVPIKISSDTAGIIRLSNLSINYNYFEQDLQKDTNSFYDLLKSSNLISEIDGNILIYGTNIGLDLSIFNISLNKGSYDLKVEFLEDAKNQNIRIVSDAEYFTIQELVDETKIRFGEFLNADNDEYYVVKLLGLSSSISNAKEKIENYEKQIGFVDDAELFGKIEEDISNLPWQITFSSEYNDNDVVEPSDIDYVGDNTWYGLQNDVSVSESARRVVMKRYNGQSLNYRLIEKTILANTDLENLEIYEIMSSPVEAVLAEDITAVSTYTGRYDAGELKKGNSVKYYYLTSEDEGVGDFTTVVYWEPELECESDDDCLDKEECLNNFCVKKKAYSWMFILVIALIVAGGVYYFITKTPGKKKERKEETEDNEIAKFIKEARKKGVDEKGIRKILENKGWSKEEIDEEMIK